MAKKRIVSKTEKKLRGQLKYQRSTISAESNKIKNLINSNIDNLDKKIGKKKITTVIEERMNSVMKRNKNIDKILKKLERFKYKPKLKKSFNPIEADEKLIYEEELGSAWDLPKMYKKLSIAKYYKGIPINKSRPDMYNDLSSYIIVMESDNILYMNYDVKDNVFNFFVR